MQNGELDKCKSDTELLSIALNENDIEKASDLLVKIYIKDENNFRKTILLSEILPDPSSFDINSKKHILETFKCSYLAVNKDINLKNNGSVEDFTSQCLKLYNSFNIFIEHHISNENVSNKVEYLNYNMSKQLQMFCIFIEDQVRLARNIVMNNQNRDKLITGTENQMPINNYKLSSADVVESYIEMADELFRFIYYLNSRKKDRSADVLNEDVLPYELPTFELIIRLTEHRVFLKKTWDKVKYRGWNYNKYQIEEDIIYEFAPENLENYKKESASIERSIYSDFVNVVKVRNEHGSVVSELADRIDKMKNNFDINNLLEIFILGKDTILPLKSRIGKLIDNQLSFFNMLYGSTYRTIEIYENISIEMLIDTIKFLYTIGLVYKEISHRVINFDNKEQYRYLAPVIEKKILIDQLANANGISKDIACKCIDALTFMPKTTTNHINIDVFSQPLIYLSNEQLVFAPAFVLQMNVPRIIEKYLSAAGSDVSDKGTRMEKLIQLSLSFSPFLQVNRNKVEFVAFDGRGIEFDFLALFDDNLIVMELKCRNTPYSEKEKHEKEDILKEAVDQVNRRVEVIYQDWEKIKALSSIKLPNKPPCRDKIIKVACFNFFCFTGITLNDVVVTDFSAITRFFNDPKIIANLAGKDTVEHKEISNLWGGDKPTPRKFREYLALPYSMKLFYNSLKLDSKPILRIEKDNAKILIKDYYLSKDPIKDLSNNMNGFVSEINEKSIIKNIDIKVIKPKQKNKVKNKISKESRKRNRKKK